MKYILIVLGSLSLVLGVIGIFLPLIPTTPLLLLSAALYIRSSEKLYLWLINQKHLGAYIRNFRENKAIPLRAKIISVSMVWISLSYCAITISESVIIKIIFLLLATAISLHILSYKTLK
ncbi:MAG: YbaN family protein [Bacteroidaceae bacterium]|nr:YbaN family protein [Bacteroidaceae bacterium]MBQ4056645.1 YbaN family protein [Bacteroidaceae bacterium]MBR6621046.1 YbaN family protein [Bacteroides sp.]